MVSEIKAGVLPIAIPPKANAPTITQMPSSVGEFIKADLKEFVAKTQHVEGLLSNYIQGFGDIEEVAPRFKEMMLEFEVKSRIASSLATMIKTITSMPL